MKFKGKSLVTNLLVVVLIISTISFPTISHAEGSSILVEPNEYDENIIPDIYNTGAHGTLTKIGINETVGDLYYHSGSSNGGTIRVLDFYYRNKDVSGTIVIENVDFSDYNTSLYHADAVDREIKLVFNNCKFAKVSLNRTTTKVSAEFNNCSFIQFTGGNATFNYCNFGGSYTDGMVPFQDVYVNSCLFYDMTSQIATEGEIHTDGTQIYGYKDVPVKNVYFDNCRFEVPPISNPGSTAYVNACFMLQLEFNSGDNIHLTNSYLNGGGYSVYARTVKDEYPLTNVSIENVKFGCTSKYGKFYTHFDDNVTLKDISNTDSLYIGSVWKDSGKTHFSVTNDTDFERTLTIVTDKGTFTHTIPACPKGDELNDISYADMPFDIDISVPSDCGYAVCYDTTFGNSKQLRFVNWTGNNVYIEQAILDDIAGTETVIASGSCGKDITYTLTNTGVLTLSGTGATNSYHSAKLSPWSEYNSMIKEIVVEEGITGLGAQLFSGCSGATKVTLPNSLTSIGGLAFAKCTSLVEFTIPANVTSIGNNAFQAVMLQKVYYTGANFDDVTVGSSNTNLITKVSGVPTVDISYRTHVQTYGWQDFVTDGAVSGTTGKSKRLEGIEINVTGNDYLGVQYTTHCQSYGWLPWSANGEMNGTEGEAKRLEAIKLQLTGDFKDKYDIYYRVHAQSYGWLNWAKNGEPAGTAGYAKRLEGIQIVVVKKNETFNRQMKGITSQSEDAYIALPGPSPVVRAEATDALKPVIPGTTTTNVAYKTHVQTYGWQGWKYNGDMSGTSGKAKRLEGINIKLTNQQYPGAICYTTHVQSYGWQGKLDDVSTWKSDGEMSGTKGEAKRLEAICICLTGDMAKKYDVYYRVHAQSYGWLGWAKNGEPAGTAGYSKRLEGIQIVLVQKGKDAPSIGYDGITSTKTEAYISK